MRAVAVFSMCAPHLAAASSFSAATTLATGEKASFSLEAA